jgi:hypothetical protein
MEDNDHRNKPEQWHILRDGTFALANHDFLQKEAASRWLDKDLPSAPSLHFSKETLDVCIALCIALSTLEQTGVNYGSLYRHCTFPRPLLSHELSIAGQCSAFPAWAFSSSLALHCNVVSDVAACSCLRTLDFAGSCSHNDTVFADVFRVLGLF